MLVHFRSGFNATMIPFSAQGLWKDDSWWNPRSMRLSAWSKGGSVYWPASIPPAVTGCLAISQTFEGLPVPAKYAGQDVESCHSNECGISTEAYCETTSSNPPSCRKPTEPSQAGIPVRSPTSLHQHLRPRYSPATPCSGQHPSWCYGQPRIVLGRQTHPSSCRRRPWPAVDDVSAFCTSPRRLRLADYA